MVLKSNKKDTFDSQPPEAEEMSTPVPEEGPLSTDDITDLDLAVAAQAAAAPELSSDDMAKLNDEMESERAEFGEVESPEEGFFKGEGTGVLEILEAEAGLMAPRSVTMNGQLSDLHFVDRGTGEFLATENIDPFNVLLGASAPPPWPFDEEDIPEI